MSVEIEIKADTMTARLIGEIDHHSAADMRFKIDEAAELNMPSSLVLDFGKISFMDSSGIGLVLGRYRNLSKRGAKLRITGAVGSVYKMLKIAGIENLVEIEKQKEGNI